MSQNSRNKPGETGNSGRGMNDSPERNSYEGFEGMNYEQVRQPYPSQDHGNNNSRENRSGGQMSEAGGQK